MIDLATMLPSWELALQPERKFDHTVNSYLCGVRLYLDWCTAEVLPPDRDRHQVNAFVADPLAYGLEPSTARARQLAIRRFSVRLVEVDELNSDPLLGLNPPKLDENVIPTLTDDQIKGLLKAGQARTSATAETKPSSG